MATGAGSAPGRGGSETVRGVSSASKTGTRPDFVPVVIFGVDPEDGDGRHLVVARDLLGELERGERLEQREQRSAEEPGLLAGDDGDRLAIGEQRARFAGARRRLAPLLLRGDHARDVVAAAFVAPACGRSRRAQAPRSAGSPAKNGATAGKSYA